MERSAMGPFYLRNRHTLVAALLALAIALPPAGWAAAGACNDLSRPDCIEQALERADRDLNEVYASLIKNSTESRAQELRETQRAWIETRNRTCRLPRGSTTGEEWIAK